MIALPMLPVFVPAKTLTEPLQTCVFVSLGLASLPALLSVARAEIRLPVLEIPVPPVFEATNKRDAVFFRDVGNCCVGRRERCNDCQG
jgi:hypothetical protein